MFFYLAMTTTVVTTVTPTTKPNMNDDQLKWQPADSQLLLLLQLVLSADPQLLSAPQPLPSFTVLELFSPLTP